MKISLLISTIIMLCGILLLSCDDNFLEEKPDKALLVPETLEDLELLLDDELVLMNRTPALGMLGADNHYLPDQVWQNLFSSTDRNAYIWAEDIFEGEVSTDWNKAYEQVFYANVVLDEIQKLAMTDENEQQWQALKGRALFYRSMAFYYLVELFAAPYDENTAEEEPGIPLRLTADINVEVGRGTVAAVYQQIINDLNLAMPLLSSEIEIKTRPTQPAIMALLARINLSMRRYETAMGFAEKCLQATNTLIDYNTLDLTVSSPFPRFNDEVIFHSTLNSYATHRAARVDTELYQSYAANDLRKEAFFAKQPDGLIGFKGFYTGLTTPFGGIITSEVWLILAECKARMNDKDGALAALNELLESRWAAGTFESRTAATLDEALEIILEERRKELVFKGLRWSDLRRLNREPEHAKTLTRNVNGQTYTLTPESPKYVYPIPEQEIAVSGIEQNHR